MMETIKPGKFVEVAYDLFVGEEGKQELMEKATAKEPLRFVFGLGQMLESFEKQLATLQPGDTFDFTIPSQDAYGEYDDDHVIELPKSTFLVNGKFDTEMIYPGNVIPMMDSNGNRLNGSVVEIKDDIVVMDFNHPLAGEDLHFVGSVLLVRDATPEEITPHSCGGCGSGCNCGEDHDCGSGCGGGCRC